MLDSQSACLFANHQCHLNMFLTEWRTEIGGESAIELKGVFANAHIVMQFWSNTVYFKQP